MRFFELGLKLLGLGLVFSTPVRLKAQEALFVTLKSHAAGPCDAMLVGRAHDEAMKGGT
jgi:hypothetical protein